MPLTLRVKSIAGQAPGTTETLTLDRGSATLGRSSKNDLILPDPQRVVSKQHCIVEFVEGQYRVTDTSTNGVFLNRAEKPIGRGNSAFLEDGDQLRISHYEIAAQVSVPSEPAAEHRSVLSDTQDMPERRESLDRMIGLAERTDTGVPNEYRPEPIIPDDSGIWAPSNKSEGNRTSGEHISPEREFFEPPKVLNEIPEDWHEDLGSPGPSPEAATEIPPPDQVPPPAAPPQTAASSPSPAPARDDSQSERAAEAQDRTVETASEQAALRAFLAGAKLDDLDLPNAQAAETMHMLGQVYREVVTGLMEILAARSSIKNEFRLSQTTIQPAQNNPLKFSLGADDAMTALLTRRGQSYLPPVQAIRESVSDIKAHQVAVLAGMQIALKGLLCRFDPAALEERMRKDRGLADLLSVKKARYWDAFGQMYQDLIVEAEDDFHSLFGKEFNRAYEDQVRKLEKR
jgi:type VI secretion system protein